MKTTDFTFRARTDRRFVRTDGRSERFVLVDITAPPPPRTSRVRPSTSRSCSIGRAPWPATRSPGPSGGRAVLARLHRRRPFAVVVYDDQIDVVVRARARRRRRKRGALAATGRIDARGSTNLGEGWLRGCEQVATACRTDGVNRCCC